MESDEFWKLYLDMSGDFNTVYEMSRLHIKDRLSVALGVTDWPSVLAAFESYILEAIADRVPLLPGSVAEGSTLANSDGYRIVSNDDWLGFEFTRPAGTEVTGNLLFARDERLVAGGSELHQKQYQGGVAFGGYRFGIRYDQHEVGLYDYATDQESDRC